MPIGRRSRVSDVPLSGLTRPSVRDRVLAWLSRPGVQSWAARNPLTRRIARRDGEALFDLVAGFVHTQALAALLGTGVIEKLADRPAGLDQLAFSLGADPERLQVLLRAGVALDLLRQRRDGAFALTRKGAVLPQVPGLAGMIDHHSVLYRDLTDPVRFYTAPADTELSGFWPYVFGAGAATNPQTAERYSRLMSESQSLVAEETLAAYDFKGTQHLMDVGGGHGTFLKHVVAKHKKMRCTLFDLPAVVAAADVPDAITPQGGSFRDDPLPQGADTISLIRVLYDHSDDTVLALLSKVHDALPPGGTLLVSEPMLTGSKATDVYFATYTLAMGTGKTRSPAQITELMKQAGFGGSTQHKTTRPFITSVLSATKDS